MTKTSKQLKRQTNRQQLLRFEVDQSVKIEQLNQDTVIGIANKKVSIAYVIPRKIKRHFNEHFRKLGQPKKCAPTLFAAAIVAILKKENIIPSSLIIDTEYNRYEKFIINFLQHFLSRTVIYIQRVGKNSPAHSSAYYTHTGHKHPVGVINRHDIQEIINKKTTGEPQHLEFTRIHKSNRSVNRKHSKRK